MSRKLLLHLNGDNSGAFRKWIDQFNGEPRIAWYPSAGMDFRDLLYLNPRFSERHPANGEEPQHPDIFIHTDYMWSPDGFRDTKEIYSDRRTSVVLSNIEELPRCDLPIDKEIVYFQRSDAAGRVFFLKINVTSQILGSFFSIPVIYACVVNEPFCAKILLDKSFDSKISHVIHVRYGGGCGGGGKSTGTWLLNVLKKLKCECFVSDGHYGRPGGDKPVYKLYPELFEKEDTGQLEQIRVIPSKAWSNHGDVSWSIVRPALQGAQADGLSPATELCRSRSATSIGNCRSSTRPLRSSILEEF